jgi:hypothetical protein
MYMPRITITVPKQYLTILQTNAVEKSIPLAQYVRGLMDAGFNSTSGNQAQPTAIQPQHSPAADLPDTKTYWKHDLAWSLECRYLLRYLVDNLPQANAEKCKAALSLAKEKAQQIVDELMPEH